MEMPKEVFEDFLVVLDTQNTGAMQKGNELAHQFTIMQGRNYTKHPAFLFFLDFLSKGEEGAKITGASEREVGRIKKKVQNKLARNVLSGKPNWNRHQIKEEEIGLEDSVRRVFFCFKSLLGIYNFCYIRKSSS